MSNVREKTEKKHLIEMRVVIALKMKVIRILTEQSGINVGFMNLITKI